MLCQEHVLDLFKEITVGYVFLPTDVSVVHSILA